MSEGSELHFNMQNLEPQRTQTENRKFLPLIDTDDADQEMQNLEPQREQRNTEETRNDYFLLKLSIAFGLQFFCHFAEGLHDQLRLVKMDPVRAFFSNEMFAAQ